RYDDWIGVGAGETVDAAVDFLGALAGAGGTALELGIGTGRIALPLAARGIPVTGVDASPRMVEQLRAKPGGGKVHVGLGDLADVPVADSFDLIYIVASTLYCLLDHETQMRCLRLAGARLRSTGRLVIEAFVPDPARFDRGQRVEARAIDTEGVRL